ncbi:MAG: caspase family protein [Cyanobacteria bacterium P01_F01_bin.116]
MSRDALIVGINQYQHLPRLTAAARDAEGIANILETHGDFRVRRLPEIIENQRPSIGQQTAVSMQQLEQHLVRLLLPKGDHIPETVCFYFSGHGIQREIGIREGYLAASDTQPNSSSSGLSLSWLRRLIKHSPVRQILIILDCCHSGEFISLKDEVWQGRDGQSYLFIAASREYEEAYESLESGYSVLTQAVISALPPQRSENGRITSADLVASLTNQLRGELQQPLFEQGGSEITITRQTEKLIPKSDNISIISRLKQYSYNFCPYRGYEPFEEKHAEYYFGRECLIKKILHTLKTQNICALVGASGCGKTSLLRAGIIPHLSKGKEIPGSDSWLVRYVQLDSHPIKALASAFTFANQEIEIASQLAQAEELLSNHSHGLSNLVTAALLRHPTASKFWLVLDQFESLLTCTTDPEIQHKRQQVIRTLMTTLCHQSQAFGIIISLRSNAIDDLLPYSDLSELIKNHQILISPMSYQNICDVIEKPAEKLGLKVDPYLIHNLSLDLSGAPGELALLQMMLYELWRKRTPRSYSKSPCLTLDSYMKLGRLSKLIVEQATNFYETVPKEEQPAVQRIFLALCDLGEGRLDQSRQVRSLELINSQYPKSLIDRLLQKLADARLIVSNKIFSSPPPQPPGRSIGTEWETRAHETSEIKRWLVTNWTPTATSDATIELAHKTLITDWLLLRQWLQEKRPVVKQSRDIEERAWIWHHRGEPKCSEYLLSQQYLKNTTHFLKTHSTEFSTLAQKFIKASQQTARYQRWQTRGIAVLLPISVMAGITLSLVRHQLPWPVENTSAPTAQQTRIQLSPTGLTGDTAFQPLLPKHWGVAGSERLAITSQILDFHHRHPHSELSQIPVVQIANLIAPSTTMESSVSLPEKLTPMMKLKEND